MRSDIRIAHCNELSKMCNSQITHTRRKDCSENIGASCKDLLEFNFIFLHLFSQSDGRCVLSVSLHNVVSDSLCSPEGNRKIITAMYHNYAV